MANVILVGINDPLIAHDDQPSDAVVNHSVDWSKWAAGQTIQTHSWIADAALTVVDLGLIGLQHFAQITGGEADTQYEVYSDVTFADGQRRRRGFLLRILAEPV